MGKPQGSLKRSALWAARGAWWLVTPWRWPERVRFVRARAAAELRELELARLLARTTERGASAAFIEPVDLFDNEAVARRVDLPLDSIFWPPVSASEVVDLPSAARFCIGLWREDDRLRQRFPRAFSADASSFLASLGESDGRGFGLSPAALAQLQQLLRSDFASRARQYLLVDFPARAELPDGLLPTGNAELLRWYLRHARFDANLSLEEVWWLFLEAAQDPQRELTRAYLFTPAWQSERPDALTVFGREGFVAWFRSAFGADGNWLDVAHWPEWQAPAMQLRIGYAAHGDWREAFPDALFSADRAREWLSWLASLEGPLDEAPRNWCRQLDVDATVEALMRPGANIVGHFCYPSGLRVSAESLVQGLAAVGIPASLRDLHTDFTDDPRHVDFDGMECHDVTIIHAQPVPFFERAFELANLSERVPRTYRIAYWYWEFDTIPVSWLEQAGTVDEVWTATEFVARGLRERLPVPVRTLFPGVKLAPFEPRGRRHFGLSDDRYTFVFNFHMMSVMERKNPLGLIRAFRQAFRPDEPVELVLKTSSGERHPQQFQQLRDAAAQAGVTLINEVYSAADVLALIDACDAYVSLHRSEGLGLTMAEAMLLGKPVIATNFSGNVDFMDEDNSLLVPYEIVTLHEAIPPYGAGLKWAQPSEAHAAQFMRRLYENQAWGRELGARARESARTSMSLEASGRRVRARLEEIRAARGPARHPG